MTAISGPHVTVRPLPADALPPSPAHRRRCRVIVVEVECIPSPRLIIHITGSAHRLPMRNDPATCRCHENLRPGFPHPGNLPKSHGPAEPLPSPPPPTPTSPPPTSCPRD